MVAYLTPVFTYPTLAQGTWGVVIGGDCIGSFATSGTYASSGYVQLDKTKWASTVTAVAANTPATGKVRYSIGAHSYAIGDSINFYGIKVSGSIANGYNGAFTVTGVGSSSVDVTNATTGTATFDTNSVARATWSPSGNLLNLIPQKDVMSIDIHRGRSREDQAVDVGVMTIVLDNRSGDYDIDNATGNWQFPIKLADGRITTMSSITRGMFGQLIYSTNGTTSVAKVFTGVLESCECDQDIFPTVTMTFVDVLASVAQADIPEGALRGADGDTSKARIGKVIGAAGIFRPTITWNAVASRYDYTYPQISWGTLNRTHEAADLSGAPLEIVENIAASEGGRVFATVDGKLQVISHADLPTAAAGSDYTLTDAGSGGYEYTSITTMPMHKQVINSASVITPSGKTRVATAPTSISRYGVIGDAMETTLSDDAATSPSSSLQALATFLATRRAQPSTAFSAVEFELRGLTAADIGTIIGGEIADKVTVRRQTSAGLVVTAGCWIEGIDINLTPDSWTWTLYTSAIDAPSATY